MFSDGDLDESYAIERIDWKGRWPFWLPEDVLSPIGMEQYRRGFLYVQPHALDFLHKFAVVLDRRIFVNLKGHEHRGYRSPEENRGVGGEPLSFHCQGIAFDINAMGMSPEELYRRAINFGWHGVGLYPGKHFVHVDLRPLVVGQQVTWTK